MQQAFWSSYLAGQRAGQAMVFLAMPLFETVLHMF